MIFLILCVLVGIAAHYAAVIVTGYLAATYIHYEDFVSEMLDFVYIGSVTVMIFYLVFGSISVLFTFFAMGLFFTLIRVDLEEIHRFIQEEDSE